MTTTETIATADTKMTSSDFSVRTTESVGPTTSRGPELAVTVAEDR